MTHVAILSLFSCTRFRSHDLLLLAILAITGNDASPFTAPSQVISYLGINKGIVLHGAECCVTGGAAVPGEGECCASYQLSTLRTCQGPVSRNVMLWCNVSRLPAAPRPTPLRPTPTMSPLTLRMMVGRERGPVTLGEPWSGVTAMEKVPRRQPWDSDSVYNFCDQLSRGPDV